MKEPLISFETAKLAKEKNIIFRDIFPFNYSCYLKNGDCKNDDAFKDSEKIQSNIPTQSLLQKWLREVHNLHITIDYNKSGKFNCRLCDEVENNLSIKLFGEYFNSYEEALEIGLYQALKLI